MFHRQRSAVLCCNGDGFVCGSKDRSPVLLMPFNPLPDSPLLRIPLLAPLTPLRMPSLLLAMVSYGIKDCSLVLLMPFNPLPDSPPYYKLPLSTSRLCLTPSHQELPPRMHEAWPLQRSLIPSSTFDSVWLSLHPSKLNGLTEPILTLVDLKRSAQ